MSIKTLAVTLREGSISRVFENRVQSRIFESKMNAVTGGWRRLHSKKLHNLESLLNRKMGGGRHEARMGGREISTQFWLDSLRETAYLKDIGVDRNIK
jgi:hypothetical protein